MSVTVTWDDEGQTILRFDFEGQWMWEEFHSAHTQNLTMMDSVNHTVDHIVNMSQSAKIPSGALHRLKMVAEVKHRNNGTNIFVGTNYFMRALGQAFLKVYPLSAQKSPFDFAATVEEAHEKIRRLRSE